MSTIAKILCLLITHEKVPKGLPFEVSPKFDEPITVWDLKVKVSEVPNGLKISPTDLKLWKLCEPRPVGELTPDFLEAVQLVDGLSEITNPDKTAVELYLENRLVGSWPEGMVHILVELPPSDEDSESESLKPPRKRKRTDNTGPSSASVSSSTRLAPVDNTTIRRSVTVNALFEKLNEDKFLLVRGTPGSGKSTLAELLALHIREEEPETNVIKIADWPRSDKFFTSRLKKHKFNIDSDLPIVIIFDEAQTTYWDFGLWNVLFKSITSCSSLRIILFASYGSPSSRPADQKSNIVVPDSYRISLRPIDHEDKLPSVGIFLTADEFTEMVQKNLRGHFTADFLDYVQHITAGHVGAVDALLRVVQSHSSYRELENGEYSIERFRTHFPMQDFSKALLGCSTFQRGLPTDDDLQSLQIARVFRTVLSNSHVTVKMIKAEDRKALDKCYKGGWLHAARHITGDVSVKGTEHIFATSLHRSLIEYRLATLTPEPTTIREQSLFEFALKVVHSFSHRHLSSPRSMGTSETLRPLEAQYQDEFYRCFFEYTQGSLISFPEFGDNTGGSINFYIPSKQWGIKVLRDGNGLENYSTQFTQFGEYTHTEVKDWIILDFRQSQPQKEHPELTNLYHVVFDDDYGSAKILKGVSLEQVDQFELSNE